MGKRRNRNKVNAKGRNQTSRFARLDHRILRSNAYRSLSPNARSLLVELVSMDNGENNGSLYLSVRDAAPRLGVADLTAASKAFDDLIAMGFIEMTQDAYFSVKASSKSRARCWRLTWLAGPGRKAPSWTFEQREPEPQTPQRKRMERGQKVLKAYRKARDSGHLPVLDSDIVGINSAQPPAAAVLVSNTPIRNNGGNLPKLCIRDSATHIAVTMGKGSQSSPLGWWQPDWTPSIARLTYAASLAASIANTPYTQGKAA